MTNKLYQYKDITKSGPVEYSGTLALKLLDDTQYNVSTPVNKAINYQENKDVIILNNTLDSTSSSTMKFNLSFKVNKDVIGVGTRNILDFLGLLSVKSENNTMWFKFYYEDAPAWKYINASELVDGWNNVALVGDGVKITLTVNSTVHTILDSSVLPTYDWISGFSDAAFIRPNALMYSLSNSGEFLTFEHTIKIRINKFGVSDQGILDASTIRQGTGAYIHSIRWTITSSGYIHYRISTDSTETYPVNITGNQVLPLNTDIICKATYNKNTGYQVQHSVDNGASWITDGTSTVTTPPYKSPGDLDLISQWGGRLGRNASSGYVLQGDIDLAHTVFKYNGVTQFDGATATQVVEISPYATENVYWLSPLLTRKTDRQTYPSLSIGTLKTYQSWIYLKDIEAVKIADASGGDASGGEPPVQASALPQGWAMWQISSGVFRYSKGLPKKDSDGYYDSYALYTNINVDDLSQYQTEDSVVLGESEGSASKYIIQAKGTPITLIASKIQTSDDKKGK